MRSPAHLLEDFHGVDFVELPEPPKRTLRIVLFANEEFGLSGAKAYPAGREAEIEKHVLALEADLEIVDFHSHAFNLSVSHSAVRSLKLPTDSLIQTEPNWYNGRLQ